MAYTAADLTTLETALANGVRRVKFDTGREVEYRSIKELQAAIAEVAKEVNSATRTKVVLMYTDSGY